MTARFSIVTTCKGRLHNLKRTLPRFLAQENAEVIVVDYDCPDGTAEYVAANHPRARLVRVADQPLINLGHARNLGAAQAVGEYLVFLDADCVPQEGWLSNLTDAYPRGFLCAGGAFALPPGLGIFGRLDYYCGWYHAHPQSPAGVVANHPPGNVSAQRELFLTTGGFNEAYPVAYAHEELAWQQQLASQGIEIFFEPAAIVAHYNREGFVNLLKRNFRWGYSAVESKHGTCITRLSWLYRYPLVPALAALFMVPLHTLYIVGCWLRAGTVEPLVFLPFVFAARCAYGVGMTIGALSWLEDRGLRQAGERPDAGDGQQISRH